MKYCIPAKTIYITFSATNSSLVDVIFISRYNYVATSTWSNDLSILRGVDSVASGTVTLGDETADVPEFDRYLETIQPGRRINHYLFHRNIHYK